MEFPIRGSWVFVFILLLTSIPSARARSAIFVQGVAALDNLDPSYPVEFTQLRGEPGTAPPSEIDQLNWGGRDIVTVGREENLLSRALLRFPLAGLAGKYTHITAARLVLTLNHNYRLDIYYPHLPIPITFQLHRILPANADWTEGSTVQPLPVPGAACWAWRLMATEPWQGARGCGQAGTDFVSVPVATATLDASPWVDGTPLVFNIPAPGFLGDWADHPANNAGFLLRAAALENLPTTDTVLLKFQSDDHASAILRPRLEIEYDDLPSETLATAPFQAGVAAVSPDPAYQTNATSLCSAGGLAYGGASDLRVGMGLGGQRWRSILRFDLARLGGRAEAVRALRLTLTVQSLQADADTLKAYHVFQLDRIMAGNATWHEGSASAAAESGAAAWDWLAMGYSRWAGGASTGAGVQVSGVDYAAPPLARRVLVPADLKPGDTVTFDFPGDSVLFNWLKTPAANAGFRLSSPTLEEAGGLALGVIQFDSDDAATPARRPRLEVIYKPSPSAADPAWAALRP